MVRRRDAADPGATPRLRYDKVALRLVQAVRDALEGSVPAGLCVIYAVPAPIREPSKTVTALIETVRARLSLGAVLGEHEEALHGDEIRVRVVTSRSPHAARVAGFVHTPVPRPNALLDMAQSLLEGAEAPNFAASHGATPSLATPSLATPSLATLRRVCEQVLDADGCAKVAAALQHRRR